MTNERDEREPLWPPPREDPEQEPSHPGARLDERERDDDADTETDT